MPECVADGCKVRQLLRHGVPQKPSIGHIHFRIPHGLPQRTDAKQMLDQHQLKQYYRITAEPSRPLSSQYKSSANSYMRAKFTAASIFRSKGPLGTSISVHSISAAWRCSASFFSIFITCPLYSKKGRIMQPFWAAWGTEQKMLCPLRHSYTSSGSTPSSTCSFPSITWTAKDSSEFPAVSKQQKVRMPE